MKILGVNKGVTSCGKTLRHGGAAAWIDGKMIAVAEERVTGQKYAGGYSRSLNRLLAATGLDLREFDRIGVSTCCETEYDALADHELSDDPRLRPVNHHLSHASLAYYPSPFDRALVVVIDGGGNVLDQNPAVAKDKWWAHGREQHSYYVASRKHGLRLVARDFDRPFETGMGELYRAFTYYLGWHSSTHSSKTMALAGHGRRDAFDAEPFCLENERLVSPVRNRPFEPIEIVNEIAKILDLDFGEPRMPGGAILGIHLDVAAFIQKAIERGLQQRLSLLRDHYRIDSVCFAGGLALNVVANGALSDFFPGGVYVPSAPSDEGQSLGNVHTLLSELISEGETPRMKTSSSAFLGPEVKINSKAVAGALVEANLNSYVVFETSDFSHLIARLLAGGTIVCIYQSRSEFGPRALGARSILADPRTSAAVPRLNSLKGRDYFMPFAPAVLAEEASDWFEGTCDSPFMSFAVKAKEHTLEKLAAVVNSDGTARIQTVHASETGALRRVLERFAVETGVPVLLNTSFNLGGQPIVESLEQAMRAFEKMPINVLGIGRFVVVKSLSPSVVDLPLAASLRSLHLEVYPGPGVAPVRVSGSRQTGSIIRKLQDLTGSVVFVRTEMPLYGEYLDWLRRGRKVTTIRFRKGAVEIPFSSVLPLFATQDFGPGDRSVPTEQVMVLGLRYSRFGDLSEQDARRDGFESRDHMRAALAKEIYPDLEDEDWVTVYDIRLLEETAEMESALSK